MTEEPFKAGDVVFLNSGGPDMTIESVSPDGAMCVWFDSKRQRERLFAVAMLQRGKPGLVEFIIQR